MGFTLLHTCCKRDRDWIKGLEKEMLLPDKFWFTISVKGGGRESQKSGSGEDFLAPSHPCSVIIMIWSITTYYSNEFIQPKLHVPSVTALCMLPPKIWAGSGAAGCRQISWEPWNEALLWVPWYPKGQGNAAFFSGYLQALYPIMTWNCYPTWTRKGRLIGAGVSRALLANAWLSNSGAAVGRYMNAGSDAAPCTRLGSFFQTTEIQRGWDMVLHWRSSQS